MTTLPCFVNSMGVSLQWLSLVRLKEPGPFQAPAVSLKLPFTCFPGLRDVVLQGPMMRGYHWCPNLSRLVPKHPTPTTTLRSPDCGLNVTFAFAVEYPETLGHSLFHSSHFFKSPIYVACFWRNRLLLSSFQSKVWVQEYMISVWDSHTHWIPVLIHTPCRGW